MLLYAKPCSRGLTNINFFNPYKLSTIITLILGAGMARDLPKDTRLVSGRALHSDNYKQQNHNNTLSPIGEIL